MEVHNRTHVLRGFCNVCPSPWTLFFFFFFFARADSFIVTQLHWLPAFGVALLAKPPQLRTARVDPLWQTEAADHVCCEKHQNERVRSASQSASIAVNGLPPLLTRSSHLNLHANNATQGKSLFLILSFTE